MTNKIVKKPKGKKKEVFEKKPKPAIVRSGKNYFTERTQLSILEYNETDDRKLREKLYIKEIEPVFKHLIENVVFTFGYNSLSNLESLKDECLMFLLSNMNKYDPEKISPKTNTISKAFTYITVITKNWLYHESVKQDKIRKRNITFEDIYVSDSLEQSECLYDFNQGDENIERQNFNKKFLEFLDLSIGDSIDTNMCKYVKSIKELFVNCENIETFTKRFVNFQIAELSGLQSNEIYICANKFKAKYKEFLNRWNNGVI